MGGEHLIIHLLVGPKKLSHAVADRARGKQIAAAAARHSQSARVHELSYKKPVTPKISRLYNPSKINK